MDEGRSRGRARRGKGQLSRKTLHQVLSDRCVDAWSSKGPRCADNAHSKDWQWFIQYSNSFSCAPREAERHLPAWLNRNRSTS
eukprot:5701777-Prymnesium_polylepis.1